MAPKTLSNKLNPLSYDVPIVNSNGTPTPEFQRKWAQQQSTNSTIPDLTAAVGVSAALDLLSSKAGSMLVRGASLWNALAPATTGKILRANGTSSTPSWDTISNILDTVGSTRGSILYRGASGWAILAPGTNTYVLTSNGAGADPSWAAGGGGGTGPSPANPTATAGPAAVNGSATTYMRSDAAPAVQTATTAQLGLVKPDGTTITISGGVISAAGSGSGVVIGSGAPTALDAAGTVYSRSDEARAYSSQPVTSGGTPSVAQHTSGVEGSSVPGSVSLPTAPTAGNLLIAWICFGSGSSSQPTIGAGWTQFETAAGQSGAIAGFALYRYVQSGDTAALPAFCSAGGTYWSYAVYEISGVTGTFSTDMQVHEAVSDNGAGGLSSLTSTAENTGSAHALALIMGGQYDAGSNCSISASSVTFTMDEAQNNGGNFGNIFAAHSSVTTSGTAVDATVSYPITHSGTTLFQCIIAAGSGLVAAWDELPLVDGTTITRNSSTGVLSAAGLLSAAVMARAAWRF